MTTRLIKSSENINGLPIGFQEVEYLQSSGTQYIDTGITGNINTKIEAKVYSQKVSGTDSGYCIAGDFTTSTKAITMPFNFVSNALYSRFGDKYITTGIQQQDGAYIFAVDKAGYYVNSTKIANFNTTTSFTTDGTIMLFGFTGLDRNYLIGKMYYCKIWNDTTLVGDFVPALNPAGRPCMYDLVGKKAYYNLGSGEFTYGRKIIPVEYLESTGTQYIDINYIPSNTTGQYAKMQYTTVNNSVTFGCMVSGNGVVGPYYATSSSNVGWWTRWGTSEPRVIAPTPTTTDTYEMYLNFNNDRIARVDSTIIADNLGNISGSYPTLTLFKRNYTVGGNLTGKVFNYKITEGTNLVRDYIPCIDESNIPYMFDKVTHTCYLNTGTGTFNYGKKLYSSKVRLYKDSEANKLPAGFKRVEYLQSSGSQYIDTGVRLSNTHSAELKLRTAGAWIEQSVFGARRGASDNNFTIQIANDSASTQFHSGNSVIADFNNSNYVTYRVSKTYVDGQDYTCYVSATKRSVDANIQTTTCPDVFTNQTNAYLFSISGSPFTQTKFTGRIYYCKIWNNDTLVCDFIPALDTTNTPCMYDTVTQTAFYNQGTGQFTYGSIVPNKVRLSQSTEIRFPKGYTEVEYLASNGNQYIDTEVLGNGEFDVDYQFYQTENSSNAIFAGTRSASQHLNFGQRSNGSTGGFSMAYLGEYWQAISSPAINTNIRVQISYKSGSQTGALNGTAMTSKSLTGTEATNLSIYIFKRNHYSTDNVTGLVGRIYYFKLWNNGALVRYFIPALDPNGKPCMWDAVTKQPFYNQGTGEFTYGRTIQQVSYLESTGTQYINTGYAFQDNFSWEVTFDGISDGCTLFGGRTSSTRTALLYQRNYGGIDKTTCPIAGYNGQETPFQLEDLRVGKHKIKMSVASNKGSVWVDSTQAYNNQAFTGTYISGITQVLFADNFGTSVSEYTSSKVYNLKMWQGSNIVRDYIPAIDSNNVGFMFDRVTHTIFDNKGTGSFNYGSLVFNKIRD